ncbi:DNA topoisomerase IB [Erythrobacter sp. MTPC3]|uniref:DNA topoisomerase IB n=1 Tax=Erythrobacter sp. MTPC3 TaxID=3056564 RepID=UPI0036F21EE2
MEKLIYVDDSLPGITRRGAGKGFAYYMPEGDLIRDRAVRRRLNAIALPPAYRDAWFCPAENGHILATGYDDAGRKQYRYHPEFRLMREGSKFDRCEAFGRLLPLVRKRVADDLAQSAPTMTRTLASAVHLLDLTSIRIGSEQYTRRNESYGATTLRSEHVEVAEDSVALHFTGKGGRDRQMAVESAPLAKAVEKMADLGGDHIFQFEDEDGQTRAITADDVNSYLRETMGEDITAKNFRTWHGSVLAFERLAMAKDDVRISDLLDLVSDHLGNTPATARKSYIHPAVIAKVETQSEWRASLRLPRATRWLSRSERGLITLIEESPQAADLLAA